MAPKKTVPTKGSHLLLELHLQFQLWRKGSLNPHQPQSFQSPLNCLPPPRPEINQGLLPPPRSESQPGGLLLNRLPPQVNQRLPPEISQRQVPFPRGEPDSSLPLRRPRRALTQLLVPRPLRAGKLRLAGDFRTNKHLSGALGSRRHP